MGQCARWEDAFPVLVSVVPEHEKHIKAGEVRNVGSVGFSATDPLVSAIGGVINEVARNIKRPKSPHGLFYRALVSVQNYDPRKFLRMPLVIPEMDLAPWGLKRRLDLAILDYRFGQPIGIEIDGPSHYGPCDENGSPRTEPPITDEERAKAFREHTIKDREIKRFFNVIRFSNLEIEEASRFGNCESGDYSSLYPLITGQLPMSVRTPYEY